MSEKTRNKGNRSTNEGCGMELRVEAGGPRDREADERRNGAVYGHQRVSRAILIINCDHYSNISRRLLAATRRYSDAAALRHGRTVSGLVRLLGTSSRFARSGLSVSSLRRSRFFSSRSVHSHHQCGIPQESPPTGGTTRDVVDSH